MPSIKDTFRHPKMVRIDISLPKQIIAGLKLIRSATGIPTAQWLRAQIYTAVQLELARQPGFFWLRPGSTIYRLDFVPGDDRPIPTPVAKSEGGERVWIMEFVVDWWVAKEDWGLPTSKRQGTIVCDVSSPRGINMRRVAVAAVDVLPRENLWVTGLGAQIEARARDKYRQKMGAHRIRAEAKAARITPWRFKRGEGRKQKDAEGVDGGEAPEQDDGAGREEEASPPV